MTRRTWDAADCRYTASNAGRIGLLSSTPPSITYWLRSKFDSPAVDTHRSPAGSETPTQNGSKAPGKDDVQREAAASCPGTALLARFPAAPASSSGGKKK